MPFKKHRVRDDRAARDQTALSVHHERHGELSLVTVSGELDLATHEALIEGLKRAEASDTKPILLDLSSVTFIDSTGVRLLVQAHRHLAEIGRRLRISLGDGLVREVVELSGIVEYIEVVD
jgi:anti-sigma B factor antagonist